MFNFNWYVANSPIDVPYNFFPIPPKVVYNPRGDKIDFYIHLIGLHYQNQNMKRTVLLLAVHHVGGFFKHFPISYCSKTKYVPVYA